MIRAGVVVFALLLAAPAQAQMELGLRVWHSVALDQNFSSRQEYQLTGEWNPWGGLRLRPGLRVAGPITVRGNALGYADVPTLGTFTQVSPCFFLLWGWDLGALRVSVGPGFSHHVRLTATEPSARGLEAVVGESRFGHIDRLDFTDHAGVEAVAEVAYALTDRARVSLGLGFSHASVRLLVIPQENPEITIGHWRYITAFNPQLGFSWRFGG